MELRRHMAVVEQALGDPLDDVVVFGVHHHQRAFASGGVQHIEHLAVIELELVVGGVHLERGVAFADQVGQVVVQGLGRGVRHDQVKAVVDDGLGAGTGVVVAHHFGERHAPMLCGKRDDGGVAPKSGGYRGRVKVVGSHHPVAGYLLHMAVAVDATWQHPMAGGVNVARTRGQARGQGVDEAIAHAHIHAHAPIGIHHGAVADGQVKLGHSKPSRCKWNKGVIVGQMSMALSRTQPHASMVCASMNRACRRCTGLGRAMRVTAVATERAGRGAPAASANTPPLGARWR